MAHYVDGYVIPIKKKNLLQYKKMAKVGCKVWMEHGALFYYECLADDVEMPWGGVPFPKLCKLKADETAVFAFVVYKSRAHRNAVLKRVHSDPRMSPEQFSGPMPFDMKRMSMAGFQALVQSTR